MVVFLKITKPFQFIILTHQDRGLITYLTRFSMIALIKKEMFNDRLREILSYVPSAIFPAIIWVCGNFDFNPQELNKYRDLFPFREKGIPAYKELGRTIVYLDGSSVDKFWKKEFEVLRNYCDQVGIEFLSTPFDVESATFLNDLMDVFKISSSDITNKPFIEFICNFIYMFIF